MMRQISKKKINSRKEEHKSGGGLMDVRADFKSDLCTDQTPVSIRMHITQSRDAYYAQYDNFRL
jgi:hypothetical protein